MKSLLLVTLYLTCSPALTKPLFELGLGAASFYSVQYPASDQNANRIIGLPLIIYRGDYLQIDQRGLRSDVSEASWYDFDISFSAAFPADSEDNTARTGMEDLHWLFQIGPSFEIKKKKNKNYVLDLRLQARTVFSTNFKIFQDEGQVYHPLLFFRDEFFLGTTAKFFIRTGIVFAGEDVQDYFYEVTSRDVTATRAQYNASSGILEAHLDLGWTYQQSKDVRWFFGLQYNDYSLNKNKNSPLFIDPTSQGVGIGVTWNMYKSKAQASVK